MLRYTIEKPAGYLRAGLRVAFIADTRGVQMSPQYIALLGRQRGLQFEAFEREADALAWLSQR